MRRIRRIMKKSWKPRFHELEHASKMRVLKTHSHTSERQGNEAGEVREMFLKGDVALRGRDKSSTKAIAMSPATEGGGRGRCMEKRKVNIKNEKKNNTEDAKKHLNPGHNSGNAPCATDEWPNYPDQPRHQAGGVGRTKYAKTIPSQTQEKTNKPGTHLAEKSPPKV